jgi:hypothetical protein
MKTFLTFMFVAFLFNSCIKIKSVYIKNDTKAEIEIIYDDRVYRSQLDTTRTLAKQILKQDSTFFIGPDSSISNIFPDYIQINSPTDTIILIGRKAIRSMINETNNNESFITIR